MSDNPLSDLLGQLLRTEKQAASGEHEDDNQLAESLKALAGRSGGPLEEAVNGFLGGKGDLYEAARADATQSSGLTQSDVTTLLTKQFGLPAAAAAIIAALVIKLLPSIGKPKKDAPAKKKKAPSKPKKTGTTKKASSKKPKAKKKADDKPKASASKPAARKKKPSTSKKKTAAKTKPSRRTGEIPAVEEPGE